METPQSPSNAPAPSTTPAQPGTTAAPAAPASTTAAPAAPTLDDVYKEFNVDHMAANFRPQPSSPPAAPATPAAAPAAPATPENIPDPVLDPAGYKSYMTNHTQSLRQSLSQVAGMVTQMQANQVRQQEEADIKHAVQSVKAAGFEADDDFIEIALGQKARQDARFLTIYKNRQQNPVAWGRALAAFANEAKGKFAFKTDSTLAENVRAAKLSTQTTQSTNQPPAPGAIEQRFTGKVGAAFDAEWDRLVRGGVH